MTTKVVISESADADLLEIGHIIAQDSLDRAISFISEIQETTEKTLSVFPESGSPYKDDLRYFTVRRYVFVYEYIKSEDTVLVLNIYAPKQDWK